MAPKIVESTKGRQPRCSTRCSTWSGSDSGKIRWNIEPVDVARLLHELELQYRPLAEARAWLPGAGAARHVLSDPDPAAADRGQPDFQCGQVHAEGRRAGGRPA